MSYWCVMCGSPCDPGRCRYASVGEIHALLRPRCIKTQFHYAAVMALPKEERRPLCFPCINWRRRSRRDRRYCSGGAAHRVTYTPLDSILMFALQPGHTPEPDYRCLSRLVRVAVDPCNAFATIVPVQIRTVLESVVAEPTRTLVSALLRVWWEMNEGTVFFRSPGTARAVRALTKREPGILVPVPPEGVTP